MGPSHTWIIGGKEYHGDIRYYQYESKEPSMRRILVVSAFFVLTGIAGGQGAQGAVPPPPPGPCIPGIYDCPRTVTVGGLGLDYPNCAGTCTFDVGTPEGVYGCHYEPTNTICLVSIGKYGHVFTFTPAHVDTGGYSVTFELIGNESGVFPTITRSPAIDLPSPIPPNDAVYGALCVSVFPLPRCL